MLKRRTKSARHSIQKARTTTSKNRENNGLREQKRTKETIGVLGDFAYAIEEWGWVGIKAVIAKRGTLRLPSPQPFPLWIFLGRGKEFWIKTFSKKKETKKSLKTNINKIWQNQREKWQIHEWNNKWIILKANKAKYKK